MMTAAAVACLLCYIINASASHGRATYSDAVGISLMLCVSFGITNTLVAMHGLPDAILFFPALDALFAWMVWRAWRVDRAGWKIALCGLLVAQLAMHVALITAWHNGVLTHKGLVAYVAMINVDFAFQLLIVGGVGAAYWMSRLRDVLSGVRRKPVEADAQWRR